MPGQGFSGIAGYNRFRTNLTPTGYGYWDAYGAGVLPGGNLRVSPGPQGQQRSMPGIDVPVVGYPETGWYSGMPGSGESVIPGVNPTGGVDIGGGGAGEFYGGAIPRGPMRYPYPDMNIPTNENVSPRLSTQFYTNPISNPLPGVPASYPDLSGLPPVDVSAPTGFKRYPDLSGMPPVMVTGPGGYPVPGVGGLPSYFGGGQSWQSNAARSAGGFAGQAASNAGFGGGLASLGGGGWQTLSEMPALGGMSWQQAFGGGGNRVLQN